VREADDIMAAKVVVGTLFVGAVVFAGLTVWGLVWLFT
jgi:hypothetical protein